MQITENIAILLAAGSGTRLAGATPDKVLWTLAGKPVVRWSADTFAFSGVVARIIVTFRDDDQRTQLSEALRGLAIPVAFVRGGDERQDSVRLALTDAPPEGITFIHDAARPFFPGAMLPSLLETARKTGSAILAHRVVDTIKEAPDAAVPVATELRELRRERLWAMETPQVFRTRAIRQAYSILEAPVTDDAAVAQRAGLPLTLVENPYPNPKLTRSADLRWLEFLAARGE